MRASAPGKIVVSGAYAVLEGSPAMVTAVDRYVTADTDRPADFVTPEVRAALGDRPAPWFDASALREHDKKLGLGSSAAIVVASLAALEAADHGTREDGSLRDAVLGPALAAHRRAQGGGSGIDVAVSAYGKTIIARRGRAGEAGAVPIDDSEGLVVQGAGLPGELIVEVWASGTPASTPGMVRAVRELAGSDAARYRSLMAKLDTAAKSAVSAAQSDRAADFVAALAAQCDALDELGHAAGVPIVTQSVRKLARKARQERAIVLPAGAGGGDIAVYAGLAAPSAALREAQRAAAHQTLQLSVEARGVHVL